MGGGGQEGEEKGKRKGGEIGISPPTVISKSRRLSYRIVTLYRDRA